MVSTYLKRVRQVRLTVWVKGFKGLIPIHYILQSIELIIIADVDNLVIKN